MPINATNEYFLAEKRYLEANTKEEKIVALEDMIRELPKHKGTENLLAQLKRRLAKLKAQETKKKGRSHNIEKTGNAQICIVGETNSGKSSLLKELTGKNVEINDQKFTTTKPEIGIFNYEGALLQIIEIPATLENKYLYLLDTCDLILALYVNNNEKEKLKDFLNERKVLGKTIFISSKSDLNDIKISTHTGKGLKNLKELIWEKLELIRVYTKTKEKIEKKPIILKKEATIKDLALNIHKDFFEHFKFARIFDNTKYSGRKVGLKYKLKEGDTIEIFT
jgi:hypothetical protein